MKNRMPRKDIVVDLKMYFGEDNSNAFIPRDVPISLIIERLQNLASQLTFQVVSDAKLEVPPEDLKIFLDGVIKTDREKLRLMLE